MRLNFLRKLESTSDFDFIQIGYINFWGKKKDKTVIIKKVFLKIRLTPSFYDTGKEIPINLQSSVYAFLSSKEDEVFFGKNRQDEWLKISK